MRTLQPGNIFLNRDDSYLYYKTFNNEVKRILIADDVNSRFTPSEGKSPTKICVIAWDMSDDKKPYLGAALFPHNCYTCLGIFTGNKIQTNYMEILTSGQWVIRKIKDGEESVTNHFSEIVGLNEKLEEYKDDYSQLIGKPVYWDILKNEKDSDGMNCSNITLLDPQQEYNLTATNENKITEDVQYINLPQIGVISGIYTQNKEVVKVAVEINSSFGEFDTCIKFEYPKKYMETIPETLGEETTPDTFSENVLNKNTYQEDNITTYEFNINHNIYSPSMKYLENYIPSVSVYGMKYKGEESSYIVDDEKITVNSEENKNDKGYTYSKITFPIPKHQYIKYVKFCGEYQPRMYQDNFNV